MASASSTADSAALQDNKEQVEGKLDRLLTGITETSDTKLKLCESRQAQKTCLENSMQLLAVKSELQTLAATTSGLAPPPQSSAELAKLAIDNSSKLASCWRLVRAFQKSQRARDTLQACLEVEHELLNEMDKPVRHSLQTSLQAVEMVSTNLALEDPQMEQRHTTLLLRCTNAAQGMP